MSGFTCTKCSVTSAIFKPTEKGVGGLCERNNLQLLGSLPIAPKICRALDEGKNPIEMQSPVIEALFLVEEKIKQQI